MLWPRRGALIVLSGQAGNHRVAWLALGSAQPRGRPLPIAEFRGPVAVIVQRKNRTAQKKEAADHIDRRPANHLHEVTDV